MTISQDLHIHTNLSACAERDSTVESYFVTERDLGVNTMGIADHFWDEKLPHVYDDYRVPSLKTMLRLREKAKEAEKSGIRLLVGAEAEYDRVRKDVAILPETAQQLDFLLVPNSHLHITMTDEERQDKKKQVSFMLTAWEDILRSEVARFITAIPHPFAASEDVMRLITDKQYEDCFRAAAEKNIAIEINTSVYRPKTIGQIVEHDAMRMYSVAKQCGCKFTFGSDAHAPVVLDAFYKGYIIAQYLELCRENILVV